MAAAEEAVNAKLNEAKATFNAAHEAAVVGVVLGAAASAGAGESVVLDACLKLCKRRP